MVDNTAIRQENKAEAEKIKILKNAIQLQVEPLVPVTDPILKKPLVNCSPDLDRKALFRKLNNAMAHYQGIGLSANQIGINERVFVMYGDVKKKDVIACFDPIITDYSDETIIMDEGCLTWPGVWLKIRRPEGFRCVYYDVDNKLIQVEMHGLEARIFQHEYDHMEGTNFTQKVSSLKLNMAKRRAAKMKKRSMLSVA